METLKEMTSLQSGELKTGFTPGASWGLGWSRVSGLLARSRQFADGRDRLIKRILLAEFN